MYLLFRSIMVIVFFLVWMVLWQVIALAIVAAGPILGGMALADLPKLMPTGEGTPSPFVIAAGLTLVGNIFLVMCAMLISEYVPSAGRFVAACFKAAFVLMLLFGVPFAAYLFMGELSDAEKLPPVIVFALAMLVPTVIVAFVLAPPFLAWVSERPRGRKPATVAAPPQIDGISADTAANAPVSTAAEPVAAPAAPMPGPMPGSVQGPIMGPVTAPAPVASRPVAPAAHGPIVMPAETSRA
ncbi:hypothetical protein [Methylobrevis pamukkalensis]|uniref:Uncharacterized protein n=1 Tax=Methylobrevis pamukkalensis TaxID=1439726 RepID=A0A1E3GZ09_9HYPH|nr:hypothetical protein [Methylobrevis pamukkalensis]ODN69300.1 hypothetical protein A6302_03386 [Methylobrevis pamukkalensis]